MKEELNAIHGCVNTSEPCSKELRDAVEIALKESEGRFRAIFDAAEDAIFIKNTSLIYTHVNPAIERMFDKPAQELIGKDDFQLFSPGDAREITRDDKRVLAGESVRREGTRTVNGIARTFNVIKMPIRNSEGDIVGVCGISRDVTMRKNWDDRLEKLNQCFLAFGDDPLDNINRLVALCGDLLNAACALYNRLEDEHLHCLGHWNAPPDLETIDTAEGHICFDVIRKNNKKVCLVNNLPDSPYADTDPNVNKYGLKTYIGRAVSIGGEHIGSLCVVYQRDYTPTADEMKLLDIISVAVSVEEKRRTADQLIKDSRQKYRNLIENITDVIFQLDIKGNITYISPSVQNYVAITPEQALGRNYIDFVHKEDLSIARRSFFTNLEGGHEAFEFRILSANGTVKHVRTSGRQLIEKGKVAGLIGTLSDMTVQKQMEQELFQSRKMEAIGQLAGGVAHDFNNMLASILGNAEILNMKLADQPALAEYVQKIVKASEHASNLTRQLLSFARKDQFRPVPVDIHQTLAEVVDILSNTIDRRIRIIQEFNAYPSTVMADPSQLENAILNLGLNARDAMPNGGNLTFSTDIIQCNENDEIVVLNKIAPGKCVRVSITDTGVGMSPDVMEHLFEPFFTTKEPGKGTGLGLASAYGIIQNHKGYIEILSQENMGTTVNVFLVLVDRKVEDKTTRPSPMNLKGTGRLMLVDDEPLVRDAAAKILGRLGYHVKVFEDGEAAVEYFQQHPKDFELVILDMIMPKLNGKETFIRLRKIDPGIKILLSTGYSVEGEAQEVMDLGASGFVQKPYRISTIASAVREALGGDK